MNIFRLDPKSPNEVVKALNFDFTDALQENETIVTAVVTGSHVENTSHSEKVVFFDISGGTEGELIIIKMLVTGSLGTVEEAYASMTVLSEL